MGKQSRLTELFCKLVEIDSPSGGERQMADFLKIQLKELGFSVYEDNAGEKFGGDCGNVYGTLAGTVEAEPLLFCAHMDTVEPALGKRAVLHEDGVITGAGDTVLGADDLAGVAAILEAVREIREGGIPHRPLEVLFTVSEETYCTGVEHVEYSRLRSRQAYVLDLSGKVGEASNKAASILSFQAEILGKAAHAGFAPEQGVHAIQAATLAISRLRQGRIDEVTVANVGLIEGGTATNIVPDHCTVRGEVRSYDHAKAEVQVETIRSAFETAAVELGAQLSFSHKVDLRAYEMPLDHPVARRFCTACQEQGVEPSFRPTFGGSDNNEFAIRGIMGLVIASAMNGCHSLEEYTTVEELERIKSITRLLMCTKD